MTSWVSERELNELVVAIVSAEDPALIDRACSALNAMLAENGNCDPLHS